MADHPQGWETRGQVKTLFRRFAFERFAQTRDFTDALAALAEAEGVHPQNINFGSTYVNVTLDPTDAGEANHAFALRVDALYKPAGT